jgi:hypothetical protein
VPDPDHPGPDLLDAHLRRLRPQAGQADKCSDEDEEEASQLHGLHSLIREKCLLVKEKWAIVLTAIGGVCYRRHV